MAKLKYHLDGRYSFFCKGCGYEHLIWTVAPNQGGPTWTFNGDINRPTFTPSVNVTTGSFAEPTFIDPPEIPPTRCHFFITDGKVNYLSDCTHHLKGQLIELDEIQSS